MVLQEGPAPVQHENRACKLYPYFDRMEPAGTVSNRHDLLIRLEWVAQSVIAKFRDLLNMHPQSFRIFSRDGGMKSGIEFAILLNSSFVVVLHVMRSSWCVRLADEIGTV